MNPPPANPFSRFINQTEMVSLGSLARTIGWLFVTVTFALTSRAMMLTQNKEVAGFGFQLALAVLGGLGYATTVGAYNTRTIRKTSREHLEGEAQIVEAKERGKAVATGLTGERPAIKADTVQQVVVHNEPNPQGGTEEEHQWRSGREPTEGLG